MNSQEGKTPEVAAEDIIYKEGDTLSVDKTISVMIDSSAFEAKTQDGKSILKIYFSIINNRKEAFRWRSDKPLGFQLESSEGLTYTRFDNDLEAYKYGGSAMQQITQVGVVVQPKDKKHLSEVFEVPTNETYTALIYIMKSLGGWNFSYHTLMWKVRLSPE